ncbi:hypothetical protein V1477_005062 [Vespula maculifrons]|uniref:Uncharacterized protein n=1 Tax=Vespula maculifrons TaxID=7453 RepID=A0ABD2CNP0_VESMC
MRRSDVVDNTNVFVYARFMRTGGKLRENGQCKQREAEATARAEATTATGQRILPGHRQDAHSSHTYASLWGIIGRQTN